MAKFEFSTAFDLEAENLEMAIEMFRELFSTFDLDNINNWNIDPVDDDDEISF